MFRHASKSSTDKERGLMPDKVETSRRDNTIGSTEWLHQAAHSALRRSEAIEIKQVVDYTLIWFLSKHVKDLDSLRKMLWLVILTSACSRDSSMAGITIS